MLKTKAPRSLSASLLVHLRLTHQDSHWYGSETENAWLVHHVSWCCLLDLSFWSLACDQESRHWGQLPRFESGFLHWLLSLNFSMTGSTRSPVGLWILVFTPWGGFPQHELGAEQRLGMWSGHGCPSLWSWTRTVNNSASSQANHFF